MVKLLLNLRLVVVAAAVVVAAPTFAGPFTSNVTNDVYHTDVNGIPTANDDNDGSPDLYEAANSLLSANYTSNSDLDSRFVADDDIFTGNGNHTVALIGLTAGAQNTLGVYSDLGVANDRSEVLGPKSGFGFTGDGSIGNPFDAVSFNIVGDFGWSLQTELDGSSNTYFSESAMNVDSEGLDHTMTFNMPELNGQSVYVDYASGSASSYTFANAFMIGWEDLPLANGKLGDEDYDDMIYLVDFRPVSVPEPSTLLLMLLGVVSLLVARRRVNA